MSLKAIIPGTAEYSKKHYRKYIRKKVGSHDVLLLVEWADGTLTELPADYRVEDNTYVASNGLHFKVKGKGGEPVQYHGVETVRCLATVGCPFDTATALAAEFDEERDFEVITEGEQRKLQATKTVQPETTEGADAPPTPGAEGEDPLGDVATDGGATTVVDREYDFRPPKGAVGWTFSLSSAAERVPNPVSPMDLKDAEERGKQSERGTGEFVKMILIGAGMTLGILLLFLGAMWLFGQLGNGGGGGGGVLPMLLPLFGLRNRLTGRSSDSDEADQEDVVFDG